MRELFLQVLNQYLNAKDEPLTNHPFAHLIHHTLANHLTSLINNKDRYLVNGSAGKGNWASTPWLAIFDIVETDSAQHGVYPVYLFKSDMSGVYLSLNQGVTDIKAKHKKYSASVLRSKSSELRHLLPNNRFTLEEINLRAQTELGKLYEAGNIGAIYYSKDNFPAEEQLVEDLKSMLNVYQSLLYRDSLGKSKEDELLEINFTGLEKTQRSYHYYIENTRNSALPKKAKLFHGYTCKVCGFNFEKQYGEIGKGFIEAHHLTPVSQLNESNVKLDVRKDFIVLCSNCHRMIHKLDDVSDYEYLRQIINEG